MTHTGYSTFVRAQSEAEAVEQALDVLEAERALQFHEVPILVEDLGDDEWEVVMRVRVSDRPGSPSHVADQRYALGPVLLDTSDLTPAARAAVETVQASLVPAP